MSVVGMTWLWNGLGIVQVERGWSAVIAGSVIFSAGAVLMGLSVLIRQLEALQSGDVQPPVREILPQAAQTPQAAPIQPASLLADQDRADKDRPDARELADDAPIMTPPALRAPPALPKAGVPDFNFGKTSSTEPVELEEESLAPQPARREAPKLQASRSEPPAGNANASAHWKSLLAKAKGPGSEGAPAVASPVAQPVPMPDEASPPEPEGRIARRYESQGVRYSLYEDGSIDAETDTGTYRFGSLVELRAFLDKRES